VTLDMAVDSVLAQGEKRPADAPPRWKPGSNAFSQVGEEVQVGRYRIHPPADFIADQVAPEAGQQLFRWKGPLRPDGTVPLFEIRLTSAGPMANKLEDVMEKDLQAIPSTRLGWTCAAAMRGEINGMVFARTRWSIMESLVPMKYKKSGLLYAAVDGDTLIRISLQDSISHFGTGADAAPLTFRKPPK